MPPEKDRTADTGNRCRKFCDVWTYRFRNIREDTQTRCSQYFAPLWEGGVMNDACTLITTRSLTRNLCIKPTVLTTVRHLGRFSAIAALRFVFFRDLVRYINLISRRRSCSWACGNITAAIRPAWDYPELVITFSRDALLCRLPSSGLASVRPSVRLSHCVLSNRNGARGAYSTWLTRGHQATRPAYISVRVLRGRT